MAEKKQTDSVSLRLDTNTWNKLKIFAGKQKTSPNSLVSQILDSYVEWEMSAVSAGWMVMPKPFIRELFELIDKDKIEKTIVKLSVRMAKDMNLYMRGKHSLDSWLSILRARSSRSGFSWTEYKEDGKLEIVMQHDMGENWSIYLKSLCQNVFYDLGVKSEFDHTDKTLVIKIDKDKTSSWHR